MQLPSSKSIKKYLKESVREIVNWRPPTNLPSYGFLFISVFWFAAGLNAIVRPENVAGIYLRNVKEITTDVLNTIRALGLLELVFAILYYNIKDTTDRGVLRSAGIAASLFAGFTFFEEFKAVQLEVLGSPLMYVIVPFGAIAASFFVWSFKRRSGKRVSGSQPALGLLATLLLAHGGVHLLAGQVAPALNLVNPDATFAVQMTGIYLIGYALLSWSLVSNADNTNSFIIGLASTLFGLLGVASQRGVLALALGLVEVGLGLQALSGFFGPAGKAKKSE